MLRRRWFAPLIVWTFCVLGACARHHSVDDCENPFPQIMANDAALPRLPPADGGVLVIGSVADSATHHALKGAAVLFYSNVGASDTTVARTDSAGAFAVRLPSRGRYRYSVLSVVFSMMRGSIDVANQAETLRVVMRHGPWICNVRATGT